ncbi:MAG: ribonuclease HII [Cyanobacteriota bacterium]|nr:ribonuclease HII [Cyanobacteriota bacterium]
MKNRAPRNRVAGGGGLRPQALLIDSIPCHQGVAGVDEVGRGCLFGPVFAGAVVLELPNANRLLKEGLTDSKRLSARRREALVPLIEREAKAWGLGQASAREIDLLGIRPATELAMLRALQRLPHRPELVLVDGNLPLRPWIGEQRSIVAGDRYAASIAAASVIAKESRDALIQRLSFRFPGYGLECHAGYGTAQHREALCDLGPSALHRRSFLRRLLG